MLRECQLKSDKIKATREFEENMQKVVSIQKFSTIGKIVGDSCYRVGEYLWKQAKTENKRRKILDQYIRKGLEAKGGYEEPEILIRRMKIFWKEYKDYDLEEPKLSPNMKIMNVNLGNFI